MGERSETERIVRPRDWTPNADQVGNHHWPVVSNYYECHGDSIGRHTPHHCHVDDQGARLTDREMLMIHDRKNFDPELHDMTAIYHEPEERPGCWSPGAGY